PRVIRLAGEIGPSVHGIWTRYTERFAAALLEASFSVTRENPDRCTGLVSSGVTYKRRFGDCSAAASAGALISTLSMSFSTLFAPVTAAMPSTPLAPPPDPIFSVTSAAAGFG